MKVILFILLLLLARIWCATGQTASTIAPLKYIAVETIDYNGIKDMFQVSLYARKWLTEAGHEIIPENTANWPEKAKVDSCAVFTMRFCTHEHVRGKYRTSLYVVNCRQDTVYTHEGKSIGYTPAGGFQNAANAAMKRFEKQLAHQREDAGQPQKAKK